MFRKRASLRQIGRRRRRKAIRLPQAGRRAYRRPIRRRWFRFLQPDEQGVQTGIGEEVVDYDQLGAFCGRGDPLRQYGLTYDHIGIGRNTVRRTVAHRNADFRVP